MCLQTRDFRGKQTRCPTPCLERERPRQSSPVDQALTEVHQAGAEEGASTSADCRCERIGKEVGEYTVPAIECALSEPLEPAYELTPAITRAASTATLPSSRPPLRRQLPSSLMAADIEGSLTCRGWWAIRPCRHAASVPRQVPSRWAHRCVATDRCQSWRSPRKPPPRGGAGEAPHERG